MARRKIGESRREEKQGMTGMAATPGGAPGMNPGMDRGAEEMMPQEAMAGRPDMGGMAGMMPGGAAESMEALAATIASQRIAMKAGAEAEQMAGENAEEKRIRQQRPGEGGMVPVNGPADENEADGAGAFWSDGGTAMVREAAQILQKYKQGKANLERRIIDNEQWYKMRHWEQIRGRSNGAGASGDPEDPQPASAWLFNSIANKHADAMDNYPEPNVLPREAGDKEEAEKLSAVLPVILENNRFESIYSDVWWYKLKTGTGVYGVFWNPKAENGLGDIEIRQLDILSLFWEPGIKDIQKSRNLFSVELVDNDVLKSQYPVLEGKLGTPSVDVAQYIYDDSVDTSEKSAVVDWYYKRWNGARQILHYCKFVGDTVLYASEADPNYRERGFYDHGKYPVIFDTLFVEEGTPAGFG